MVQCMVYENVSNMESNLPQLMTSRIYKSNLHNRDHLLIKMEKHTYYTCGYF